MTRATALPVRPAPTAGRRAGVAVGFATWLLLLALFAVLPGGLDRWTLPKYLVLGLAVLAAAVAVLRGESGREPPRSVVWATVGIGVAALVAALLSGDPVAGLFGQWPRFTGVLVLLPAFAGALWAGAVVLDRGRRQLRFAAAAVALLLLAVELLASAGVALVPSGLDRSGSLLGNATDLGLVGASLALLLGVSVLCAAEPDARAERWAARTGALAGLALVVLSASRAAMLAVAVGLVLAAVVAAVRVSRRGARPGRMLLRFALALAGVAAAVLLVPLARSRLLGTSPLAGSTVADRILIWDETARLIAAHPLIGVGPGRFADTVPAFHGTGWFDAVGESIVLDSPHSWPLDVLAAGGMLLAAAVAVWIFVVVRAVAARLVADTAAAGNGRLDPDAATRLAATAAVAALATGLLTHVLSPAPVLLAGMLLGAVIGRTSSAPGMSAPAANGRRARRPAVRRAAAIAVVALVWVAGVGTAAAAEIALRAGVDDVAAGRAVAAIPKFELAARLRPYDGEVASIGLQQLSEGAARGDQDAARLAAELAAAPDFDPGSGRLADSIPAQRAAAVAFESVGDAAAALEHRRRIVELEPASADARLELAITAGIAGSVAEALDAVDAADELRPGSADAVRSAVCELVADADCIAG